MARPLKVAVSVALALSGVSAFGDTASTSLFKSPSGEVGLKASSRSRQDNTSANGLVPLFSMNQSGGQADGNTETNGSGLNLAGGSVGLRPVFAGQLGDGKTLVLFQNREGEFFASVVPLFTQAQMQSQMNGQAGQVLAPAQTGTSGQNASGTSSGAGTADNGNAAGGQGGQQGVQEQQGDDGGGRQSGGNGLFRGSQNSSGAGPEATGTGAGASTGGSDNVQRTGGNVQRTGESGTRGQNVRETEEAGSNAQNVQNTGGVGRNTSSSYMGVTDAPAEDDTASGSSGSSGSSDGDASGTIAQNDATDTGASGGTSAGTGTSSGSGTSSGAGASSGSGTSSGSERASTGSSRASSEDSSGNTSSGSGNSSGPLYRPTTSPSFSSGGSSGSDTFDSGQRGSTASDSADGTGSGSTASDSSDGTGSGGSTSSAGDNSQNTGTSGSSDRQGSGSSDGGNDQGGGSSDGGDDQGSGSSDSGNNLDSGSSDDSDEQGSGSSVGGDSQGNGSSDDSDNQDSSSSSGSDAQGSDTSASGTSAGTTSNTLDKVDRMMNESADEFDQILGEHQENYDKYSTPEAAGDSVCATPDAMIKHQTESQGYLANVNPSWTWSHAGHANSALGGWDHWPADERGHLTEFKDVPGKWNRLMPWFVISRVSGSHVAADIEVRNMAVYWFPKKDKQWHLLAANLQPDAAICTPDDVNMSRCKSTFSGKASTGTQNAIHGWFTHVEVPDGAQAISVAVEARLVKGGPALMTVAGDYYPPDTVSLGGKFVPGAASSAPQRLKDNGEWTVVTMTTLTDQTKDDTGISRDMLMKRSPQCKNPARYYRP